MKLPFRAHATLHFAVASIFYATTAIAQQANTSTPSAPPATEAEQTTTLPTVQVTDQRIINRYAADSSNTASKTDTPLIETPCRSWSSHATS